MADSRSPLHPNGETPETICAPSSEDVVLAPPQPLTPNTAAHPSQVPTPSLQSIMPSNVATALPPVQSRDSIAEHAFQAWLGALFGERLQERGRLLAHLLVAQHSSHL